MTASINLCPLPFYDSALFPAGDGFLDGRLCQKVGESLNCCLPCPMYEWFYPDSYETLSTVANWVATGSAACCVALLASWAVLPVDKTARHYLSICLTFGVLLMNLGFVVPLAAQPQQCYDKITPNDMHTSTVCGASGGLLMFGGFSGVMWAFLRSVSLHLQICWQVMVGRNFMLFAQVVGWGVPVVGIVVAIVFSGVSVRFGTTCHINHDNSLADFWIPLLVFAGLTVIITFATFGYCVKVYLAALGDNSASTGGSSLPYSREHRSITPRQAYRRIQRVICLQWRGIAIVLIIIADVIFFSVIFVFQDNVVQSVTHQPKVAEAWILCIIGASGDKNKCFHEARNLVVNEATVGAVLLLLALNGIWLIFLLGRWSMVTGWINLARSRCVSRKQEFISVDTTYEVTKDTRSYEMLSKETNDVVTPLSPVQSNLSDGGRRTPDYFGASARYQAPRASFSSPRPAHTVSWNAAETFAAPQRSQRGIDRVAYI